MAIRIRQTPNNNQRFIDRVVEAPPLRRISRSINQTSHRLIRRLTYIPQTTSNNQASSMHQYQLNQSPTEDISKDKI